MGRNGYIAYTLPANTSPEARRRMRLAGLVEPSGAEIADGPDETQELSGSRLSQVVSLVQRRKVAAEFANTKYVPLLHAADFAEVARLPLALENTIITRLNNSLGPDRVLLRREMTSYINTDQQVTYEAYLMLDTGVVETVGVPLRYHWRLTTDGSALVQKVEALSPPGPTDALTDLFFGENAEPEDQVRFLAAAQMFNQYDVVSLFHAAAVFRAISVANRSAFAAFVARACAG
jgi:hypothetical protein